MRIDSSPAITFPTVERDCVSDLRRYVTRFEALDAGDASPVELYHLVLANVHNICAAIVRCEEAGLTRERIVEILRPVREVCSQSPFIRRLQEWPRGYPGDFETIEHLCTGTNQASPQTVAWFCEQFSLNRPIAQQHRNKVHHQATQVLRTLLDKPRTARIFSIACGSCADLRSIVPHLPALVDELWLNDADVAALEYSARELASVRERSHFRPGNALRVTRRMAQTLGARFDLVMAGGLFDYLPEKQATYLIEQAYALLNTGGRFFFTNIATGNPYRPLIEYFSEWFLIERSEEDIVRMCAEAGISEREVNIRRDETGLALLVEVVKP